MGCALPYLGDQLLRPVDQFLSYVPMAGGQMLDDD
jgi:hypothetical protein